MSDTTRNPLDDPAADPSEVAAEAASDISRITGIERHDIALTLGSGWGRAAELIGETTATFPATEVTGFSAPALEGHVGTLRSVLTPRGRHVLVIGARTHFYEGHGTRRVVHSVRTAAATGARTMVLTNGAGGIKHTWKPGQPVLISDHINLTGGTPLEGATFIDLTDLYSMRLRDLARTIDPTLDEGFMLDTEGELVCATMSNVFIVRRNEIVTPDLRFCGVRGVMRGEVLRIASELGIATREAALWPHDIDSADEIFITNAVRGVRSVTGVAAQSWSPGPITHVIAAAVSGQ